MRARTMFAAVLTVSVAGVALAHGGGLNAEGCHNNRKTGDYHCHRAPAVLAQKAAPPAQSPLQEKSGVMTNQLASPQPGAPTCYTGPRGGRYTITASGRKNYRGC